MDQDRSDEVRFPEAVEQAMGRLACREFLENDKPCPWVFLDELRTKIGVGTWDGMEGGAVRAAVFWLTAVVETPGALREVRATPPGGDVSANSDLLRRVMGRVGISERAARAALRVWHRTLRPRGKVYITWLVDVSPHMLALNVLSGLDEHLPSAIRERLATTVEPRYDVWHRQVVVKTCCASHLGAGTGAGDEQTAAPKFVPTEQFSRGWVHVRNGASCASSGCGASGVQKMIDREVSRELDLVPCGEVMLDLFSEETGIDLDIQCPIRAQPLKPAAGGLHRTLSCDCGVALWRLPRTSPSLFRVWVPAKRLSVLSRHVVRVKPVDGEQVTLSVCVRGGVALTRNVPENGLDLGDLVAPERWPPDWPRRAWGDTKGQRANTKSLRTYMTDLLSPPSGEDNPRHLVVVFSDRQANDLVARLPALAPCYVANCEQPDATVGAHGIRVTSVPWPRSASDAATLMRRLLSSLGD